MATFVALKHPATILVMVLTTPDNLTNDLLFLKSLNIRVNHTVQSSAFE